MNVNISTSLLKLITYSAIRMNLLATTCYCLSAWLSFLFLSVSFPQAYFPVWPPAGLALGFMLLSRGKAWPGIAIAASVTYYLLYASHFSLHIAALLVTILTISSTLEAFCGYWLSHWFNPFPTSDSPLGQKDAELLKQQQEAALSTELLLRFLLIALMAACFSGLLSSFLLKISGFSVNDFLTSMRMWTFSSLTGLLLFTPLLICWAMIPFRPKDLYRMSSFMLPTILTLLFSYLIFSGWLTGDLVQLYYVIIPLLLWVCVLAPLHLGWTVVTLTGLLAVWGTANNVGPFAIHDFFQSNFPLVQVFLCTLAFMTLSVMGTVLERTRAQNSLRRLNHELENRVMERTHDLLETRDLLNSILESSPNGIMAFDAFRNAQNELVDFEWLMSNQVALRYFDNKPGRRASTILSILFAETSQADAMLRELIRVAEQGKSFKYDHACRVSGETHWFAVTFVRLGQDGVAVMFTDINARKHNEHEREHLIKALEAKNEELESFTYTVSHDLKSPLVTIRGFLSFLEKDIAAGDQARIQSDIRHIQTAAEKMQQLLDDLLELSRIERFSNAAEEVSPYALINEAWELLQGAVADYHVQLHIEKTLPDSIYGDHSRLLQVFINLLENAIKFMNDHPAPRINIGAFEQHGSTVFYVQDNGRGMLPDQQEKAFEIFRRFAPDVPGTGIGLSLVKRIIDLHGGRIWIESAGKGQGTTFYFTLPTQPSTVS